MHRLFLIPAMLFILLFSTKAHAQWHEGLFDLSDNFDEPGTAFIRVDNMNHFYNMEYYNPMAYSYTLAGYHIKPELMYQINNTVRVSAGIYVFNMLGREELQMIRPVYTLDYRPFDFLQCRLGNLKGGHSHILPEQIYAYKQGLEQYNEEGLQVILHNDEMSADVWLDWRYLSIPNDNQPERVFGGYNIGFEDNINEKSTIGIFTQMVAWHVGGQALSVDRKMQTILNFTGGFNFSYQPDDTWSFGLKEYFAHYENVKSQDILPYKRGYGLTSETELAWNFAALRAGYWYANRFYAPLGNHLFSCISEKSFHRMKQHRHVLYAHIKAEQAFMEGLSMGARAGVYAGLDLNSTDFYIALLIRFNRDFFITK